MFSFEFGLEGSTPHPIVTVDWNCRGSAAYHGPCFDFYFRCLTFIIALSLVSPSILVKLQNFCNFPLWLAKVPRYSGRGEGARYLGICIAIFDIYIYGKSDRDECSMTKWFITQPTKGNLSCGRECHGFKWLLTFWSFTHVLLGDYYIEDTGMARRALNNWSHNFNKIRNSSVIKCFLKCTIRAVSFNIVITHAPNETWHLISTWGR